MGRRVVNEVKHNRYAVRKHRREILRGHVRHRKRLRALQEFYHHLRLLRRGYTSEQLKRPDVQRHLRKKVEEELEFKSYSYVRAPKVFSLLSNTDGVLRFVSKLGNCLEQKKKTFVELSEVTEINYDAIVVLLSIMKRFRRRQVEFNGNFPEDPTARNILEESPFFAELYGKRMKKETLYSNPISIHTKTDRKVDGDLASRLVKEATETVWGEEYRSVGMYRILIELMTNTHNHAVLNNKGNESWYLCMSHRKEERKVIFTFVDYGVGVVTSLQNKKPGEKMYGFLDTLKRLFTFPPSNADIIREIFLDEKQISSTGDSYRGYGLPSLFNSFLEGDIENLHYITNDVIVSGIGKEFITLSQNFSGTFIYWELNDTCNRLTRLP